ncbi:hypothetical protein C8J56DRAFT_1083094 [Mycena floridula]|nr:hypothetical protein C8J56DRAFT_1083094 [Mycena floridula]
MPRLRHFSQGFGFSVVCVFTPGGSAGLAVIVIDITILFLMLVFRVAALISSQNRMWGEPQLIAFIRAFVLIAICLTIPAFGIYTIVVAPINNQVVQRDIHLFLGPYRSVSLTSGYDRNSSPANVTVVLYYPDTDGRGNLTVQATLSGHVCNTLSEAAQEQFIGYRVTEVKCPTQLTGNLIVMANFSQISGSLYLTPGKGDPSDIWEYGTPIPLPWGYHLAGILTSTQRQVFSSSADLLGFTTLRRSFITYEALGLFPDLNPPNAGSDDVSLRLRFRQDTNGDPTRVVQDYSDTSVLGGFAAFGGFWTFVNGTFAMVFGANLLYFLFRRRPLSALGIIHIFQRRSLVQKWHEDFPALQTEGGLPGSESAGIVSFIRERLVDLDSVEIESQEKDIEAHTPSSETRGTRAKLSLPKSAHESRGPDSPQLPADSQPPRVLNWLRPKPGLTR